MSVRPLELNEFQRILTTTLTAELRKCAEPLIEEAVKDAEKALRKRIGELVLGMIDTSYELSKDGDVLKIEVRMHG